MSGAYNSKNKVWYTYLLNPWVIFASLILGALLGHYLPVVAEKIVFIGDAYLALLQMCIIPLIITAITTSFAKLMHSKIETQIIRRMIMIFLFSLLVSAFIGLIAAWAGNLGGTLTQDSQNHIGTLLLQSENAIDQMNQQPQDFIHNFISDNIFSALALGRNIPILIFSILLGIALGFITSKSGKDTLVIFDGLFNTFLTLVNGIMYLLPLGLFVLVADQVAKTGFEMLSVAGQLILYTYVIGMILILLFVFVIARRTKFSWIKVFYHLREMMLVAFVSGSSFASLPFGISALINDLKLSRIKVNLFFPLSACLNPVGSAYFLALVAVFVAHLYGQRISIHEFFMILSLSILTAVAIGGIPAVAGFSLLGMLFTPLGLPSSIAIVLLIAISNILDPIVTVVNVVANAMTTALLSTPEESIQQEIKELVT